MRVLVRGSLRFGSWQHCVDERPSWTVKCVWGLWLRGLVGNCILWQTCVTCMMNKHTAWRFRNEAFQAYQL